MSVINRTVALAGFVVLALSSAAGAQTAQTPVVDQNWVLTREARGDTIMATAPFSNGITVVARCSNGNFELLMAGLPEVPRSQMERPLSLLVGDETVERPYQWTVAADSRVAFSRVPAQIARQLAQGGRLQVIVPGAPGERRTRYVMTLEQSGSAIEETLTHCGRPLVDPLDALVEGDAGSLPTRVRWERGPRPVYPGVAMARGMSGVVTLRCLVNATGEHSNCAIESEHPAGQGFGQASLRAMEDARLMITDENGAAAEGSGSRSIVFAMKFSLNPPR